MKKKVLFIVMTLVLVFCCACSAGSSGNTDGDTDGVTVTQTIGTGDTIKVTVKGITKDNWEKSDYGFNIVDDSGTAVYVIFHDNSDNVAAMTSRFKETEGITIISSFDNELVWVVNNECDKAIQLSPNTFALLASQRSVDEATSWYDKITIELVSQAETTNNITEAPTENESATETTEDIQSPTRGGVIDSVGNMSFELPSGYVESVSSIDTYKSYWNDNLALFITENTGDYVSVQKELYPEGTDETIGSYNGYSYASSVSQYCFVFMHGDKSYTISADDRAVLETVVKSASF